MDIPSSLNCSNSGNQLLAAMLQPVTTRFKNSLSRVTLRRGFLCLEAGAAINRVYFPLSGLIAHVITTADGNAVKTTVVGREGAVGLHSAFGPRRSFMRAVVQIDGEFCVVPVGPLMRAVQTSGEVQTLVYNYIEKQIAEAHQLAACNVKHPGIMRLARWLLQSADRSGTEQLRLTHEFLVEMLGNRRTSVTLLAEGLQNEGLIKYTRRKIRIVDREALQASTCECYRIITALYSDYASQRPEQSRAEALHPA
jgi:CRP-like cAMP-binding protein